MKNCQRIWLDHKDTPIPYSALSQFGANLVFVFRCTRVQELACTVLTQYGQRIVDLNGHMITDSGQLLSFRGHSLPAGILDFVTAATIL
jgi:hypothetical protein